MRTSLLSKFSSPKLIVFLVKGADALLFKAWEKNTFRDCNKSIHLNYGKVLTCGRKFFYETLKLYGSRV